MKIYLSVDLEGITGVVGSYQILQSTGALPEIRELVTADVNAAGAGARQAGAEEFWVNENHSGRDLLPDKFPPDVELLLGKPKPLQTLEGLDSTFDAVFLIGMHARAGTEAAVLDHTWTTKCVQGFRVNGVEMGELGLNALLAGHFDVPVALVSGDLAVSREAAELLGDVECAVVKYGFDRYSARCLPAAKAQKEIREAAARAVQHINRFKPLKLKPPLRLELDYADTAFATRACWIPGATRLGPRSVAFQAGDFLEGMKTFLAAVTLPATVRDPIY
jgi:D-amino peptidase